MSLITVMDLAFIPLALALGVVLIRMVWWLKKVRPQDRYFGARQGQHTSPVEREFNSRASFELDSVHLSQFTRLLIGAAILLPLLLVTMTPQWMIGRSPQGQAIVMATLAAVVILQVSASYLLSAWMRRKYGR